MVAIDLAIKYLERHVEEIIEGCSYPDGTIPDSEDQEWVDEIRNIITGLKLVVLNDVRL